MARILLVEDDDSVRRMLRRTLERAEHEVFEASNGHEALERRREVEPDLIIIDLIMPEKEGLETIQDLRREGVQVPIIAMSGGGKIGADSYLSVARALGAARVLSKPFGAAELLRDIDALLVTT